MTLADLKQAVAKLTEIGAPDAAVVKALAIGPIAAGSKMSLAVKMNVIGQDAVYSIGEGGSFVGTITEISEIIFEQA